MKAATIRIAVAITLANCAWAISARAADGPVRHTAQYQSSPPPAGGSTYDRYAAPVAGQNTYAPPPSVINSAQSAATDASNSLRQSFDSGVQQINNEAVRVGSRASEVGQGYSDQLKDFYNNTSRQIESTASSMGNTAQQSMGAANDSLRQAGDAMGITGSAPPPGVNGTGARITVAQNGMSSPPYVQQSSSAPSPWSSAPSGPASINSQSSAPPLATAGAGFGGNNSANPRTGGITTTPSGWTALDRDVPPPPMRAPSDVNASSIGTNSSGTLRTVGTAPTSQANAASAFPGSQPGSSSSQPAIHSTLFDPEPPSTVGNNNSQNPNNWKDDWNRTATGNGLPAMQTGSTSGGDSFSRGPAMGDPTNGAGNRVGPPPAISRQDAFGGNNQAKSGNANDNWGFGSQPNQQAPGASIGAQNVAQNQNFPNGASIGGGQTPGGAKSSSGKPIEQGSAMDAESLGGKPWVPLLFVSVILVSSLAANAFLGWSYMDARLKYRTLVRNTADKFRRAVEAA